MNRYQTYIGILLGWILASGVFAAPVNVAVDIKSTRLSGSDTTGTTADQPGFTDWDMTTIGTSSSILTIDAVQYQVFGLAAANQTRVRTSGGGGTFNNLLADLVYNEGAAGRAVGLRITGLDVGTYNMQSWHYDDVVTTSYNAVQIEVRNQGGASTVLVDNFAFSTEPATFSFDVTDVGQVKEIIFREDDAANIQGDPTDSNRARLNGFTLATAPEPASLTLLALAAGSLSIRRRR